MQEGKNRDGWSREAEQREGRWEGLTASFCEVKRTHPTLRSTDCMWVVDPYCLRLSPRSCFCVSSLQPDYYMVQHRDARCVLRVRHWSSWHRKEGTHFKYTVNCGTMTGARAAKEWVLLKDKLAFSHIQSDILIPHFKQLIPGERLSEMTWCHQRILWQKDDEKNCTFHQVFCKVDSFGWNFNNDERLKVQIQIILAYHQPS